LSDDEEDSKPYKVDFEIGDEFDVVPVDTCNQEPTDKKEKIVWFAVSGWKHYREHLIHDIA
jgi:hypothetical protein